MHHGFISPISIIFYSSNSYWSNALQFYFDPLYFIKRSAFSYHSQDYFVHLKPADNFALFVFFHILMFCKFKSLLADASYFLQLYIVVILSEPQVGRARVEQRWVDPQVLRAIMCRFGGVPLYIMQKIWRQNHEIIKEPLYVKPNFRTMNEPKWTHGFQLLSCAHFWIVTSCRLDKNWHKFWKKMLLITDPCFQIFTPFET